ncbi:hypothetical protein ACK3TF_000061 [Chlorella vulgaris]
MARQQADIGAMIVVDGMGDDALVNLELAANSTPTLSPFVEGLRSRQRERRDADKGSVSRREAAARCDATGAHIQDIVQPGLKVPGVHTHNYPVNAETIYGPAPHGCSYRDPFFRGLTCYTGHALGGCVHGIGGCGDCLFIDANPIVQKQVGATIPWDRRVVEAQVALSRSFGCHIFMASGQSAASALQAVLPGPEGRSARVVVLFGGQPVPFILCLDGTGSLDIVVCSEHFSMMHFQPLRGGLVAATAAFSSAMHGPTPGLMARMVATVEYFDRFNELDASYRSVEARVANTRLALVDLEATMAPLAAAHQQATNAAAAVEDNFRLAQLQALPQVLLHLQGMVPLLQQAMQPVDHLTALSPRHAHRELARKSREEYDKQGGAHPQQLQPVAEGLVPNCFTRVMHPSHCGRHCRLNVPPIIVHQHMSHLLGQPFRLRGGGKEWECRLQASEAPSSSYVEHRLTAWRKCVQHMKLEVNNIVTVKVVTEGSSTILEVTAQRGSAGSGGGAQQQQQQQGDGGAHPQQLQPVAEGLVPNCFTRVRCCPAERRGAAQLGRPLVMHPSHCGRHCLLNVPPKIVHQHMSHLLGQPFRLRGGGKEWERRLQASEAPSSSYVEHRLTARRKCVQHMKLEVNNIVTVKVVTEGSSTILEPVAEGLVPNCFTRVMHPSHCGRHCRLNVPPIIVHQHMSHLLGQPFRLRGGGKEWECRLQASEAPSSSYVEHRLTAWRKCVQHMKLEVNNIVTVKVVTEGSSTILEVTAQRGSAGSGGGAQQQQQQQGDGGAHPQQLQHQHQRAAASPHLRARRVFFGALGAGPLVTAPSAGGDDPLALAQPYPQQITSPFASQAWDASARSFGSQHLQGCTQEQLQAALQVASTAYQCQMPALLQLQQQQVLQPPGSAGMRAWGGGAVELGGASLAALHPSTAMHPQGIPDHLQLPVSEGPWAWHEAGPLGYGGGGGSWGGPGSGIGGDTGGVETAAAPSAGADDAMMAMYQQFGQEGASPSASQGLSICEGMGVEENATSMDLEWGPPVPFRPPGRIAPRSFPSLQQDMIKASDKISLEITYVTTAVRNKPLAAELHNLSPAASAA